jgi:PST family polysaccharide transporter
MNAFLLWRVSSWRPKFAFAISDIKDILYFSANLTGFNVINYFARNIDQLLIGRLLGPQALGFYSLANRIMLYPIQNITGVINRVVFPAFSKIQEEKDKIRSSYLMMVKTIATLTFPLMLGLFVVTPEFVRIILGANWESAIPLIMILSFCGLVQSVGGPLVGNIRLSQGRIYLHLQIGIMNAIFVIIAVLIGLRWGIMGVTLSYTLYSFFWFFLTNTITLPLIHLKTTDLLKTLRKPIFLGLIFSCCIFLLKQRVKPHDLISLLFIIAIGIIVYSLILFLSKTLTIQNGKLSVSILNG